MLGHAVSCYCMPLYTVYYAMQTLLLESCKCIVGHSIAFAVQCLIAGTLKLQADLMVELVFICHPSLSSEGQGLMYALLTLPPPGAPPPPQPGKP